MPLSTTPPPMRKSRALPPQQLTDEQRKRVEDNVRLAYWYVARRQPHRHLFGSSMGRDDLEQEAMIGLIRAAQRFNPNAGVTFATYAIYWIRQAVTRAAEESTEIHLPSNNMQNPDRRAKMFASDTSGHTRSLVSRWEKRFIRLSDARPLKTMRTAEASDHHWAEKQLCTDPRLTVDKRLAGQVRARLLLARLTPQEYVVIVRRYGFDGLGGKSLKEIAEELHLSRERIRQVEVKAIKKMQAPRKLGELRRQASA